MTRIRDPKREVLVGECPEARRLWLAKKLAEIAAVLAGGRAPEVAR